MLVYNPFSRPANQDKKHFPLGTCPARPAVEPNWRTDPGNLEKSLAKMLGSEQAAAECMKRQRWMTVRYVPVGIAVSNRWCLSLKLGHNQFGFHPTEAALVA
jgi:hypothetical protein